MYLTKKGKIIIFGKTTKELFQALKIKREGKNIE